MHNKLIVEKVLVKYYIHNDDSGNEELQIKLDCYLHIRFVIGLDYIKCLYFESTCAVTIYRKCTC